MIPTPNASISDWSSFSWLWLLLASWLVSPTTDARAAPPSPNPQITRVDIGVRAAVHEISPHDPLFLKVAVRNPSQRLLHFNKPLETEHGSLLIEARARDTAAFEIIVTKFYLTGDGIGNVSIPLGPSQRCVCYELVMSAGPAGEGYLFSQPGEYDLRVRLTGLHEMEGASPAIRIKVRERPQAEIAAQYQAAETFYSATSIGGVSRQISTDRLRSARDTLGDSALRTSFDWIIGLAEVRDAPSAEKRREAIELLRLKIDPTTAVSKEFVQLMLAFVLVGVEDWDTAEQLVAHLKDAVFAQRRIKEWVRTSRENRSVEQIKGVRPY
ncbi:MAG: hypothetical protein ABI614_07680 [Planctomycetota bacterium]